MSDNEVGVLAERIQNLERQLSGDLQEVKAALKGLPCSRHGEDIARIDQTIQNGKEFNKEKATEDYRKFEKRIKTGQFVSYLVISGIIVAGLIINWVLL
ncbi:MAG: hypothetical protein D4S01_05690 [Dehalococcoidia bacterium]|nr:MAG: hypothetical protein D4S01_05690 [Dehalococcoidia bacterium]